VSFTITGLHSPGLGTENLSGNSFSANLGSASQQVLHYAEESNFTVTFASPIADLYVYDDFWRPEAGADYDFSQPIAILSGNSAATVAGGANLDATGPNSFLTGIVELTNVTSFTVTQNFSDPAAQDLDFAGTAAAVAAPEPGSVTLVTLGAGALLIRRRQSRASHSEVSPRA